MNFFAKNILFLRKQGKHTQADMPMLLNIGRATWSNYEKGFTEPNFDKLIGIANHFKVSIDELLTVDLQKRAYLDTSSEDNNVVSEPPADYIKKEQVNWLILQGINTLGEDITKIKDKLGV